MPCLVLKTWKIPVAAAHIKGYCYSKPLREKCHCVFIKTAMVAISENAMVKNKIKIAMGSNYWDVVQTYNSCP